jgi:mRNA-degrading endonuclease RelE of RelBE toxin-antitoxin system
MNGPFRVLVTPSFERLFRKLEKGHRDLADVFRGALTILADGPHNHSRRFPIRKLVNVPAGEGQFRLRMGRWRFRYDILEREVILQYCGLRREDTYRK